MDPIFSTAVVIIFLLVFLVLIFVFWRWVGKQFGFGSNLSVAMDDDKITIINGNKSNSVLFANIDTLVEGAKANFPKHGGLIQTALFSGVTARLLMFHDVSVNKEFTLNDQLPNYEEVKNSIIKQANLKNVSENNSLQQTIWAKEGSERNASKQLMIRESILFIPIIIIAMVFVYMTLHQLGIL